MASRTEKVYKSILKKPCSNLAQRFIKYHGCGIISGKISCVIIAMVQVFLYILDFWFPENSIVGALEFQIRNN